ncbi:hypothetical protein DFJ74DRAFT_682299 [Hyaloraphidium curvatum]|nr:hypothetical protein DFJ74DRAFT_682299 [Hyaloraphidium curvatum]
MDSDDDAPRAPRYSTAHSTPTVEGRQLSMLKRPELQALLRKYGLKGGSKKTGEMVEILEEHFKSLAKSAGGKGLFGDLDAGKLLEEFPPAEGDEGEEELELGKVDDGLPGEGSKEEGQVQEGSASGMLAVDASSRAEGTQEPTPIDPPAPASPAPTYPALPAAQAPGAFPASPSDTLVQAAAAGTTKEALNEADREWIARLVEEKVARALAEMGISKETGTKKAEGVKPVGKPPVGFAARKPSLHPAALPSSLPVPSRPGAPKPSMERPSVGGALAKKPEAPKVAARVDSGRGPAGKPGAPRASMAPKPAGPRPSIAPKPAPKLPAPSTAAKPKTHVAFAAGTSDAQHARVAPPTPAPAKGGSAKKTKGVEVEAVPV